MQRGRSREVSFSALPKQRLQSTKTFGESLSHSLSTSPHSSRSASNEPLTIYDIKTHEDFARILLLRLKGISVDNRPVIAFQPDDIHECDGLRTRKNTSGNTRQRRREEGRHSEEPAKSKPIARKPLSYASLVPQPSSVVEKPLEYPCMANPTPQPSRKTRTRRNESVAVTFQEVLTSKRGPLFPCAQRSPSKSSRRSPSKHTEVELLNLLLDVIKWEEGERTSQKGKRSARRRSNEDHCPCCSAVSPTTSSISSRRSSWLSFSASSLSTAVTTPASSSLSASGRLKSPDVSGPQGLSHACQCPISKLSPIPLNQSPLFRHDSKPNTQTISSCERRESRMSRLGKSVGRFIELARVLQNAYGIASEGDSMIVSSLRPPGYRAGAKDVAKFIAVERPSFEPMKCIPLISPFPPAHPPRTLLPDPLPYPIVFKPQILPPPSPLKRFAQSALMNAPSHTIGPVARRRYIPNPMFLRLQALKNIIWQRGIDWEGRGRDGRLGYGKEKVIGLAFEDAGRSFLANSRVIASDFMSATVY